jgi:hypothetical protein
MRFWRRRSERLLFHAFRRTPRKPFGLHLGGPTTSCNMPSRQFANTMPVRRAPLMAGAGQVRAGSAGGERRYMQALAGGAVPIGRISRVLERDAAAGEVLREAAPGSELELVGGLELGQVAVQARSFGEQAEDAPLVEHVDVVLPDHVIDGAQLAAVPDQQRRQTCEAVSHQLTSGSGMETAKPARNTGCGKPPGATSGAAPRGAAGA